MQAKYWVSAALLGALALPVWAERVNLTRAVEMSLTADGRIQEREHLVEQARAMLQEVDGHAGWQLSLNAYVGLAPKVSGGFYEGGATTGTVPRRDGGSINGLSDWTVLQFSLMRPLWTFGRLDAYRDAAQGNIQVKQGDVAVQRSSTVLDVKRAYYGYLTARDSRLLLEDVQRTVDNAIRRTEGNLKKESGEARQSDLYSLQAARGMLAKYLAQARAIERISLDGLKVLTGVGVDGALEVADEHITPVAMPGGSLNEFQGRALSNRPEMGQLESGLEARRALVKAKKAEGYPIIFAGVMGAASHASKRDKLNHPYILDIYNTAGATPVIGLRWDAPFDVNSARVTQAQAELDALTAKQRFALAGIPYEVAEAYHNASQLHASLKDLQDGAAAARRWMVASYADFNAGLEKADKVGEALRTYALTQAEYYRTVNDYNVAVAQLEKATGAHAR